MKTPTLKYSSQEKLFGVFHAFEIRKSCIRAGLEWDGRGFWKTSSPYKALQFVQYADKSAVGMLGPYLAAIRDSCATRSILNIPCPEGLSYLPFQAAGIAYASRRRACILGDEPGLGKTIQAIGVANLLGLKRLLVICPAGLRLNWEREISKWHMRNPGIDVVLSGLPEADSPRSTVISYDLASRWKGVRSPYDLVICDEGHYLKNPTARRTKVVLGSKKRGPGLIHLAKRRLVLTGTPIPNRVYEIYIVLKTLAPGAIDNMDYWAFLTWYAVMSEDRCVGARHEEELYSRLRANVLVRRLKKDVLRDLPEKRYKMVVFPASGGLQKILRKESQFSASEIIAHGAPVGTALPEIRREMGIEKAPSVVQYAKDVLEDGVQKIVIFAHHREVVTILEKGLCDYQPQVVTGSSSAQARQTAVDRFQSDPDARVFVGNIVAAGTGITLTAASDVIFAEASWVPGENTQAEDRCHRVGQTNNVLIHLLVVEGSLDAHILGAAARKQKDISTVVDNNERNLA